MGAPTRVRRCQPATPIAVILRADPTRYLESSLLKGARRVPIGSLVFRVFAARAGQRCRWAAAPRTSPRRRRRRWQRSNQLPQRPALQHQDAAIEATSTASKRRIPRLGMQLHYGPKDYDNQAEVDRYLLEPRRRDDRLRVRDDDQRQGGILQRVPRPDASRALTTCCCTFRTRCDRTAPDRKAAVRASTRATFSARRR